MNAKALLITSLLLLISHDTFCQENGSDSIKVILQNATSDTARLHILSYLSETLPDGEWQQYNEQLLSLASAKVSSILKNGVIWRTTQFSLN